MLVFADLLNFVMLTASINSDVFGVGCILCDIAGMGIRRTSFGAYRVTAFPGYDAGDDNGDAGGGLFEDLMPENVFLMIAALATFVSIWVWIMPGDTITAGFSIVFWFDWYFLHYPGVVMRWSGMDFAALAAIPLGKNEARDRLLSAKPWQEM
ncbi:MAG: hypothetical protein GPOALKHO_000992 [Sodalis sp.]|nr:MAG: hypothetical protein GPOALKHO_000992 [Sodalis sp.]